MIIICLQIWLLKQILLLMLLLQLKNQSGLVGLLLLWEHSRAALDGEDPAYRYCVHCTIDPIFKTKMAPTNLRSCLKSKHAIFVGVTLGKIQSKALERLKELYNHAESSGQIEEIDA
jgi:hypothetical protein